MKNADSSAQPPKDESISGFIIETVVTVFSVSKHFLKACLWTVFGCILPKHRKCINSDIVLITGGSRGLGRSLAIEFAKRKPKEIILWGRSEDNLSATADAVKLHNVSCTYMICDVSKRDQVYAKAKKVREKHGIVTILVNNAGVAYGGNTLDLTDEEIVETIDVNALGQIRTVKAFLPDMVNRNHGHIVSINSVLGYMSLPGLGLYVASKHAVTGFMDSLTLDLKFSGSTGVHTTSIHPFLVNTDMFGGYGNRFPNLLAPLDKTSVAEKTVQAVLANEQSLTLPCTFYLLSLVYSFIPIDALMALQKYGWADRSVKQFAEHQRSRRKKE